MDHHNLPNKFEGEKQNPYLLDKLTTPNELSGLLNKALTGLKQLLRTGKFANDKIIDDIRDEYIRRSDSARGETIQPTHRDEEDDDVGGSERLTRGSC